MSERPITIFTGKNCRSRKNINIYKIITAHVETICPIIWYRGCKPIANQCFHICIDLQNDVWVECTSDIGISEYLNSRMEISPRIKSTYELYTFFSQRHNSGKFRRANNSETKLFCMEFNSCRRCENKRKPVSTN